MDNSNFLWIYMFIAALDCHTLQPQQPNLRLSKANLLRSYSALTDEVFKESNKPDAKQRMEKSWKPPENSREIV